DHDWSLGSSDLEGMGILAAARALCLDFIPLFNERYELALPSRPRESPLLLPLRHAMTGAEYPQVVAGVGGHDVSCRGGLIGVQALPISRAWAYWGPRASSISISSRCSRSATTWRSRAATV